MRYFRLVSIILALGLAFGCKSQSGDDGGSAPQPSVSVTPTVSPQPVVSPNSTPTIATIQVTNYTGTSFEFHQNDQVRLNLQITGTTASSNLVIAMSEMPLGATLNNRNTPTPTFVWTAGLPGTYYVTFLVRDHDACIKTGAANCDITDQMFGNITANPAYDATQRYTLVIDAPGTAINNPNMTPTGTPTVTTPVITPTSTTSPGIFSRIGGFFSRIGSSIWGFISGIFN